MNGRDYPPFFLRWPMSDRAEYIRMTQSREQTMRQIAEIVDADDYDGRDRFNKTELARILAALLET